VYGGKDMSTSLIRDLDPAFRSLFEHNKDAVYSFDLYGKFTSVNRAAESISGYSSAELIGSSFAPLIAKEDLPKIQTIFQKACEGTSQSYETSIYNKSGEIVFLSVTNVPAIVNGEIVGVFGIARDISKEVTLTQKLQQSEEKYRLIAENCSDMIRTIDSNSIITYASPSHLRILGYTRDEYEGKHCLEFVHPDDRALSRKIFKQMARTKQRSEWQIRLRRKNGDWAWLEIHGQVVCDSGGSIKQFVVVSSDITDKKNNEITLRHLAFHDPLTGLMNRRAFLERLQHVISNKPNKMHTVLFLDCDKFKKINDELGHNVGDLVLCEFAQRMQQTLPDKSFVYRFAGDEFTIIMEDTSKTGDAIKLAESVLKAVRAEWNVENHNFFVTSSIGIARFPSDGRTIDILIERADNAMYASKKQGGDTYMEAGSIQRAVSQ
jgi:diguanylate cyclase (GGDEF)-like protein/PAS domain S-box-containing protein